MFKSYNNAIDYLDHARNKTVGRPFTTNLRVHKHPDGVLISFRGRQLCIIRPDDTVEFVFSEAAVAANGHSLVQQLYKVLPMQLTRKSRGVYEVWSSGDRWEYFKGITFKLNASPVHMACINPKLPLTERVDPDKRLEWRRALRKFKQQVQLRAKLGVIDAIISRNGVQRLKVGDPVPVLYEAIRSGEVTTDFLEFMLHHSRMYHMWFSPPTATTVAQHIHNLCIDTHSIELRKKFGVFREG
jgi:hypothetical protein